MLNLLFEKHIESVVLSSLLILAGVFALFFALKIIKSKVKHYKDKSLQIKLTVKAATPILFLLLILLAKLNIHHLIESKDLLAAFNHALTILTIIVGSWLLINAIRITRKIILHRYDLSNKNNLIARKMHTQLKIIERIITFTIVFVALAAVLMTFDSIKRIGISLFASAGIAGLILGLAAQKVIGSVLAGIQLAITQPIRIDDVVIVENEWGWIEEITLTYVVVRLWDKRRLVVPSTYFIEQPFQNWTRTSSDILGSVFIYTDYTIPVDNLRGEFNKLLKDNKLWDGKVANVQVTNATNQSLEIRFLMSATDSPSLWDLRTYVREKMVEYLQREHKNKLPISRLHVNQEDNTKPDR
ncbi:MAG: mechanosensitive ion channel family protein [Bacteroidales bacterium]